MTDKEKILAEIERLKESGCASPIVICDTLLAFIDSLPEESVKIKKGCKYRCLSDMQNTDTGAISFFKDKIYSSPEDNTLVSEENGWLCDISEDSSNFELVEEPISEDLDSFAKRQADKFAEREYEVGSYDRSYLSKGYYWGCKDGAQWQKEQFEKNRLKHCNSITNEQAELEQGFIDQHLDKYQRMPTFLDAIEYGMSLKEKEMQSTIELAEDHAMLVGMEKMKEQLLAKAVDGTVRPDDGEIWFDFKLLNFEDGDKVKVIVIKED